MADAASESGPRKSVTSLILDNGLVRVGTFIAAIVLTVGATMWLTTMANGQMEQSKLIVNLATQVGELSKQVSELTGFMKAQVAKDVDMQKELSDLRKQVSDVEKTGNDREIRLRLLEEKTKLRGP
jgi:hypothetical protein